MNPGIAFAILAAFLWGFYIYVLKRSFSNYPPAALAVILNVFGLVWYLPVVLTQADLSSGASLGLVDLAAIASTATATALALVLFLHALAIGEVSYVTPINKLVPIFVLPLEIIGLNEVLTPLQLSGVLVATMAVYVANYRQGGLFEPLIRAVTYRPAQLALLSAFCFAVGDLGKRISLQELAIQKTVWVPLLLLGVLLVLLPFAVRNPPGDISGDLPLLAVTGGLVVLAEHTTTMAFAVLPASIASPIINTQAIVAVLLGGLLLGERALRMRLLAAVLAVIGVTLIAL